MILADYSNELPHQDGLRISEIQKFFDITPENVRKVFKDKIQPAFLDRYLPNWEGRRLLGNESKETQDE